MFSGSIPAMVTPFRDGRVDEDAFVNLVERQIAAGSSAIVPVGTTGETSTLSHEEHRRVVELCVQTVAGRVPVIAGAGSNATAEAIGLAQHAKAVGADAALIVCPYYNRPDQRSLIAHYTAINDAVALPIIVYNVPSRTVVDASVETVAALSRLPNVVGIKDATGDLKRVTLHRARIEDPGFSLLSGDDPTALGFYAMGGQGCISVTANVAPEKCAALHRAAAEGRWDEARAIEHTLIDLHLALFASPSPGPAKYALERLGLATGEVRLPLVGPDPTARERIDAALERAGLV